MLDANSDPALLALVVWEPVISSDRGPPGEDVLRIVHDKRARQFWDENLLLSTRMVQDALSDPERYQLGDRIDDATIIWDFVAVWPPGVRWEGAFPPPTFHGAPLVKVADTLARQLEEL